MNSSPGRRFLSNARQTISRKSTPNIDEVHKNFASFNLLSDWVWFITILQKTVAMELLWQGRTSREKLLALDAIPGEQFILHESYLHDQLRIEAVFSPHSQYAQFIGVYQNSPNLSSFENSIYIKWLDRKRLHLDVSDLAYNEWGLFDGPLKQERDAAQHIAESIIDLHLMGCITRMFYGSIENYFNNTASGIYNEIASLLVKNHIGICSRGFCSSFFVPNSKKTINCSDTCKAAKSTENRLVGSALYEKAVLVETGGLTSANRIELVRYLHSSPVQAFIDKAGLNLSDANYTCNYPQSDYRSLDSLHKYTAQLLNDLQNHNSVPEIALKTHSVFLELANFCQVVISSIKTCISLNEKPLEEAMVMLELAENVLGITSANILSNLPKKPCDYIENRINDNLQKAIEILPKGSMASPVSKQVKTAIELITDWQSLRS